MKYLVTIVDPKREHAPAVAVVYLGRDARKMAAAIGKARRNPDWRGLMLRILRSKHRQVERIDDQPL